MTGIVDITAVALYMHYWGAFGDVPQWVFALGALAIVGTMNMIGVKWFAEMEFWFALVKVLAIVAFLVVGTIFLGSGKPLDGNATGFHLITDNGGFFPHGLLPALVLVQGVVFAFASIELVGTAAGECKDPESMVPKAINSVIWRIGLSTSVRWCCWCCSCRGPPTRQDRARSSPSSPNWAYRISAA